MRYKSLIISSINLINFIILLKKILIINKTNKKITVINYKKWAVNIIFRMRKKKPLLKNHCCSFMDTVLLLKKAYWNSSNNTVKGYMMTIKEVSHAIKAAT
jgi:hypothetical protein